MLVKWMNGQMDKCVICWEKLISEYFMKYLYLKCSLGLGIYITFILHAMNRQLHNLSWVIILVVVCLVLELKIPDF